MTEGKYKYQRNVHNKKLILVNDEEYTNEADYLNTTLEKWINEERFDTFPKITSENIKEVMETGKFIVLTIVEENKVNHIPVDMLEYRNKVESLIR